MWESSMSNPVNAMQIAQTVLREKGLYVSNIASLKSLHLNTAFETPVLIQATLAPNNWIEIGAFSAIYGNGHIGYCKIGRYCSIAPDVNIASDQHPTDWLTSSMIAYVPGLHDWDRFTHPVDWQDIRQNNAQRPSFDSNAVVVIGNDVWIGQGVFIKSGVTIGDGAIIGARSVVTKDIPPYSIAVGSPAKVLRQRFDDALIERMTRVEWWKYNLYDFHSLDFSNPIEALDQIEAQIAGGQIMPYQPDKIGAHEILNILK
jgi:acetyltransferase-like isoleucine patch superfamily enzyme